MHPGILWETPHGLHSARVNCIHGPSAFSTCVHIGTSNLPSGHFSHPLIIPSHQTTKQTLKQTPPPTTMTMRGLTSSMIFAALLALVAMPTTDAMVVRAPARPIVELGLNNYITAAWQLATTTRTRTRGTRGRGYTARRTTVVRRRASAAAGRPTHTSPLERHHGAA